MASPVLIDDGGSTRIKQLKDNTTMDGLLGEYVNGILKFKDRAADKFEHQNNFQCHLEIQYHNTVDVRAALAPSGGLDLLETDVVTICSENGQVAEIRFIERYLNLELKNADGGISPIVYAQQQGMRRKYIVWNAGMIQSVEVARLGGGIVNPIFDAQQTPSVFTMVFFK